MQYLAIDPKFLFGIDLYCIQIRRRKMIDYKKEKITFIYVIYVNTKSLNLSRKKSKMIPKWSIFEQYVPYPYLLFYPIILRKS